MLAHLPLLRGDAIAEARIELPQCRQSFRQGSRRLLDDDGAASRGEFAQRARDVKSYGQDYFFFRRDWRDVRDLLREEGGGGGDGTRTVGLEEAEPSSMKALRTQTMAGSPSRILFQVFPSSREPKSWPLRVPKWIPAGSSESAVMASRKTVS